MCGEADYDTSYCAGHNIAVHLRRYAVGVLPIYEFLNCCRGEVVCSVPDFYFGCGGVVYARPRSSSLPRRLTLRMC